MGNPKVGKIPPGELVPMLYDIYGTSKFNRRIVYRRLGKDAYTSMLRALKGGWLQKVGKTDGVYEYILSGKSMQLIERCTDVRRKASC